MSMDTLTTCLLGLASKLKGVVEALTLGGGFGLCLKQRHLESQKDLQTLIPGELWPPARATEDVDLLLSTEVVVSVREMRSMRQTRDDLGFAPSVEFDQVGRLIAEFRKEPVLQVARDAAVEHFTEADTLGALRLQAYVRDRLAGRFEPDMEAFTAAMNELFGSLGE